MRTTTYRAARVNLAKLCDQAADKCEPVIILRRGAPDVALVSADELRSLLETAQLLSSPANALRLLRAMRRTRRRTSRATTVARLRRDVGIDR